MKGIFIGFLLALCTGPSQAYAAPVTPGDLAYCADVQGPFVKDSLYRVHLPDDVVIGSLPDFGDLRLFDFSGRETPAVVIGNVPVADAVETYRMEITGYEDARGSKTIFVKLPERRRPISSMNIHTDDRDFRKAISIAASRDGKTWRVIAEDRIYDVSSVVPLRKTKIDFPGTDARFFRMTMTDLEPPAAGPDSISLDYQGQGRIQFKAGRKQKKEITIRSVEGMTSVPAEKMPVYDSKTFENLSPVQDKDGNTVIELQAGLPAERVSLDIADTHYYRNVYLYGSATGKEGTYSLIASRPLYRFPLTGSEQESMNTLDLHASKNTYYMIIIENKNNQPLDVRRVSLSWVQMNLYFISPVDAKAYVLCFGNAQLSKPEYDIAHFINQSTLSRHSPELRNLSPVRTSGAVQRGELRARESKFPTEKTILKIIVTLLVIGLGWWLFSLIRKSADGK
jgi:hypothetical protein